MPLRLLGRRFLPAWRFYSTVDLSQLENHESHCSKVPNENCKLKMSGWQIHTYGKTEELQFATALRMPFIESASECLVRVLATTVNPIDVAMLGGYGATILNMMRCNFPNSIEFPLILGREFCGEVIQRGNCVNKNLSVGDRVWGVVPLQSNGSHAEYVLVPDYCLSKAPNTLSDGQAASVLYAGLTAWSGLYITGRLGGSCGAISSSGGGENKRILVLGGSGSVGSIAIQILKAQNATVYATCSEDAMEIVKNLGADYVVNYKNTSQFESLHSYEPFDIVLDCAGQGVKIASKIGLRFRQYITFSSPLLHNVDNFGVGIGMIKNISDFIESNTKAISKSGGLLKYGFFMPVPHGIEFLTRLAEKKQILPLIDSSFSFDQLPRAFEKVQCGHLRGKVVIYVT